MYEEKLQDFTSEDGRPFLRSYLCTPRYTPPREKRRNKGSEDCLRKDKRKKVAAITCGGV